MYSENDSNTNSGVTGIEMTLSQAFGLLLNRWKPITIFALGVGICTALITLLIPNEYTATASILPSSNENKAGGLLSLADGIPNLDMSAMGLSDKSPSILYPEIITSRTRADDILNREYTFEHGGRAVTQNLYQYFDQENPDRAYRKLKNITTVDYDKKTGVVSVSVTTESPELSSQIANFYISLLDDFNKYQRKTSAGLNREFIETRIAETQADLKSAEERLKEFRDRNLNYYRSTDPELLLEHERLFREVELKNQIYLILAQQRELAAIQEKKEIPLVQILDTARPPSLKSYPARTKTTLLGLFAGFMTAWLLLFVENSRRDKSGHSEIRRLAMKLRLGRSPEMNTVDHV